MNWKARRASRDSPFREFPQADNRDVQFARLRLPSAGYHA